jgi:hypothetical protein
MLGGLAQDSSGRWVLANSTEPSVTKDETASAADLKTAANQQIGNNTFQLLSVTPSFKADSDKGHEMEARGLLYRAKLFGTQPRLARDARFDM